jgi:hypothetical protein
METEMRYVKVFDRYAAKPGDLWVGRLWESTRRCVCGAYLTGTVIDTRPGEVRIRWLPNWNRIESWEPTDRGTLMRA